MTFSDSFCGSCDLGIDEIIFSVEPCLNHQQGKRSESNWLVRFVLSVFKLFVTQSFLKLILLGINL